MSTITARRRGPVEVLGWGLLGCLWGWQLRSDPASLVPNLVLMVAMVLTEPGIDLLARHVPAVRRWREEAAEVNRGNVNAGRERGRILGERAGRWLRRVLGRP